MGSLLHYSAMSAKLAALKGRLLKEEDFSSLAALQTVPAAVEFLKARPAYETVFEGCGDEELHRGQIEKLLWRSLYQDYSRLYRFANLRQRRFLDLYFMHFEADVLKRTLRDAVSGHPPDLDIAMLEPFFKNHSRLDLTALRECRSAKSFSDAIRNSCYYEPVHLLLDQGITSLFEYETAMDTLYFNRMWTHLNKKLGKEERDAVLSCIGEKIDLLNLEWLSRAKRRYHLSKQAVEELLIPICYRLKKSQLSDLAGASSTEEFNRILSGTYYKNRLLPNAPYSSGQLLDQVYLASGRKNPYSAAGLNSYLHFKEAEIRKIITAVEGIRYQIGPEEIRACLKEC